ncbi:tyrosine-type recombinase/integrase, partial [Blautia sp. HCP3S3_H10_1]
EAGTLKIMQSKGHKDRLIYMSDDLAVLMKEYKTILNDHHGCVSEWVFPAREPGNCLCSVTINAAFRRAWNATPYAEGCDKTPTVHCLRHSFVVKRMNLWMEEGIALKEMLPFLSRYLGHQSTDDTFYYYHQVSEAFRIIRDRDKTSGFVIPEVTDHE